MKSLSCFALALAFTLGAGCSKKETFYSPVLAWLKSAGFKVDEFTKAEAKGYKADECARGKVDKLDVLICRFGDKEQAKAGQARFTKFLEGAVSGAMRQRDALILVVADRDKVDTSGKRIDKLLKTFALAGRG